jgi:hypothetical protein
MHVFKSNTKSLLSIELHFVSLTVFFGDLSIDRSDSADDGVYEDEELSAIDRSSEGDLARTLGV